MLNEIFQPYLDTLPTRKFQQGNILVYQGEVSQNMYVIKSGTVKLYNITQQGDERIATFKMAGDLFPTSWSFSEIPAAFYYYEAMTNLEVYIVSAKSFHAFIKNNVLALEYLSNQYLAKYAGSLMRITALEQPKASDKILYTLYYLIQRYGQKLPSGKIKINLQLTQQMVADLIGLTRETTAAELVALKKKGILTYKGREYIIDRFKLIKIIGEDNFKDLRL